MKNILLMFLGILIALVSLEVLLQTSSFVIAQANKLSNKKTVRLADNKDLIKILCIGESTTSGQYPELLQNYLNSQTNLKAINNKNFLVIDCGVVGTNINNILSTLDENMSKYDPDIVISMMGINDAIKNCTVIYNKKYNFKILELFRLLKNHIISSMSNNIYAQDKSFDIDDLDNLGIIYMQSSANPVIFENMLTPDGNNSKILRALVYIYKLTGNFIKAEKYANQYMKDYLYELDSFVPVSLAEIYLRQGKYDSAEDLVFKIIIDKRLSESFRNDYLCNILQFYLEFMPSDKILDLYNTLVKNKSQTSIMDNLYAYLKKQNLVVENYNYPNKFRNLTSVPYFNTLSIKEGYLKFAEKIIEKNKIYICMSYPTMSIETFENFFKNSKYKDKIIFVSNEHNFKENFRKLIFFDLFIDNFGGTFGHCTKLGNTLIAENVGNIIIKMLD